jgi:hypothetical protein
LPILSADLQCGFHRLRRIVIEDIRSLDALARRIDLF